jgi:DNA-binding XRE family transcriptional regulator
VTRGHRHPTLTARRELAGLTITRLAQLATCSDQTIVQLENGGNCDPDVTARILNVLGPSVALTSNTQASPTVFTSATHLFQTGDTVTIAGVTGANADPNGSRVATRVNGTTFSVPVNCGVAGGTGGTAVATGASIGQIAL